MIEENNNSPIDDTIPNFNQEGPKLHTAALKHLYDFLNKKKLSYNELTVCNIEFWKEFSSYLVWYALNKNMTDNLSGSTCGIYFGNCKQKCREDFKSNAIWLNHDTEQGKKNNSGGWFTRLKISIDEMSAKKAIAVIFVCCHFFHILEIM